MTEKLTNILDEAKRELDILVEYMPESLELGRYDSPYECMTRSKAEAAFQTIKPTCVNKVDEDRMEEIIIHTYGSIEEKWFPTSELGTCLEWVMEVKAKARVEIVKYLKNDISEIDIQSFFP